MINKRKKLSEIYQFQYLFLITPNAHCVYDEYLPDGIRISQNRSAVYMHNKYTKDVFYPLNLLKKIDKDIRFITKRILIGLILG